MKSKATTWTSLGAVVVAILAVVLLVSAQSAPTRAEETEDKKAVESAQDEKNDNENDATDEPVVYEYVAQPGDSYSKMARKAVQTYGLKYKVNLSGAQIIYAESNLTILAGSPELLLGQEVTISEADLKEWIEKAQDLSEEQQAAWEVYTATVEFNTDNVGEKRE